VVFVGGNLLPLLADIEQRFMAPRVTKDVDAIVLVARYYQMAELEQDMRSAGFKHAESPMVRWIAPNGEVFDLVSVGSHAGATGAAIDRLAAETAVPMQRDPSLRHLHHAAFLALKSVAYRDRNDRTRRDLEDLGVLLVASPTIETTLSQAPSALRDVAREEIRALLALPLLRERLRDGFADRQPIPPDTPASLADDSMAVLHRIAL
jgi:hypothetical protein